MLDGVGVKPFLLGATLLALMASCTGKERSVRTAHPVEAATSASDAAVVAEPVHAPVDASSASEPAAPPLSELPRGGRRLFPEHRLVGFCGSPGAPALGRLDGKLPARAKAIEGYGAEYARGRKPLPVFELIAVVVQGYPGADGKWRRRVADSVIDDYLAAAREAKALLLLNIQPGHSDFLSEAKTFERYLKLPDVGLALDPEWAMNGKQKPGTVFGQTTGDAINQVGEYLSNIVAEHRLPEKALVFHQVSTYVVKHERALAPHDGVVLIKSVDGLGPKPAKIKTYNLLVKAMPESIHAGFKLFFDEDTQGGFKLMTPPEVLGLAPEPEYIMYE